MSFTRLALSLAAFAITPALQAQQSALPAGLTEEMIADGAKVFRGPGLCIACHGNDGKGMKGLGANLADDQWLHSKGSYEEIVKQILDGVPGNVSTTKVVMPPRGGAKLSDDQIKVVAAYVWRLSHK